MSPIILPSIHYSPARPSLDKGPSASEPTVEAPGNPYPILTRERQEGGEGEAEGVPRKRISLDSSVDDMFNMSVQLETPPPGPTIRKLSTPDLLVTPSPSAVRPTQEKASKYRQTGGNPFRDLLSFNLMRQQQQREFASSSLLSYNGLGGRQRPFEAGGSGLPRLHSVTPSADSRRKRGGGSGSATSSSVSSRPGGRAPQTVAPPRLDAFLVKGKR